jgi:hypothetical protein
LAKPPKEFECEIYVGWIITSGSRPYMRLDINDRNASEVEGFLTWVRVGWPPGEDDLRLVKANYTSYKDFDREKEIHNTTLWKGNYQSDSGELTFDVSGRVQSAYYARIYASFKGVRSLRDVVGPYDIEFEVYYPEFDETCSAGDGIWVLPTATPGPSPTRRPTSPPRATEPRPTDPPSPTNPPTEPPPTLGGPGDS